MASQPSTGSPQPAPNAAQALQAVLSHPHLSLEAKIDAFKKLRLEGKITEQTFHQILAVLSRYHQQGQQTRPSDGDQNKSSATPTPTSGFKRKSPGDDTSGPTLSDEPLPYPMVTNLSNTVNKNDPGPPPQAWPNTQGQRPTLSGGLASGLITGAPPLIARGAEDMTILLSGDLRHGPKKNAVAEQQMRRTIQDLVSSIDPNVKISTEVEDLLLEIADEFIDSVSNFSCRLAKHRGGDTLETRDLQLHLERNHNIRIPGFASDETRLSINQGAVLPSSGAAGAKKSGSGTHMTLRSARLNAVNQAKRDNKLM